MLKEFSLEGKVAIVTGAARGIGEGIALTLAEAGADIVAADLDNDRINKLEDKVRRLGRDYLPITTDVSKVDDVDRMVDGTIAKFGKIDVLVNCAGARGADKPIIPLPEARPPRADIPDFYTPWSLEEWHNLISVDLDAIFLCTRAVGPHMIKQRSGKIINIASSYAFSGRGSDFNVPYCAVKAGVVRFTEALAKEWAEYNVNVNAIGPGLVQTELSQQIIIDKEEVRQRYLERVPQKRFGTPRDIGLLAVYLASDASSWMTGQVIYINGGETIA